MSREEFAAFHRDLFDKYYGMAERLLKSNLILPALEYALKCSHVFNILDSSGSVGVTERTAYVLKRAPDCDRDCPGLRGGAGQPELYDKRNRRGSDPN